MINSFNDKPGQKELIRARNEQRKRAVAEIAELKKRNAVNPPTPAPSVNSEHEDSERSTFERTISLRLLPYIQCCIFIIAALIQY